MVAKRSRRCIDSTDQRPLTLANVSWDSCAILWNFSDYCNCFHWLLDGNKAGLMPTFATFRTDCDWNASQGSRGTRTWCTMAQEAYGEVPSLRRYCHSVGTLSHCLVDLRHQVQLVCSLSWLILHDLDNGSWRYCCRWRLFLPITSKTYMC